MKKITPLSKQSKRARRAFYSRQRGSWHGMNPVTRTVPNGKGYDRKRMKEELRHGGE